MENNLLKIQAKKTPAVVIVGGGFGGLSAAKQFAGKPVQVILLDRSNHHLFQPLLYQVATGGLSPADIAQPIRSILRDQKNVTVILDEVTGIEIENRTITTPDLTVRYDYLIVAAGTRHSYFGNPAWESRAPGLKTIEDATEIRRRVLLAFEVAEKSRSDEERDAALTFVVVGGGPTGVEMAGAISELARFTLKRDFRRINPAQARILLVEAGPRLLAAFSPDTSQRALQQLQKLGVEVLLDSAVTHLDEGHVDINQKIIPTRTVIWAAGNSASPLAKMLGSEVDRAGRTIVQRDLTVPGHPEIQAIGDMAAATTRNGKPVPGVSPAAMQAGRHAAKNVLLQIQGKPPVEWNYHDKGSMATIGRHAAVCEIGRVKFGGLPAWLAWAFVHLYFLIGFRSRSAVFLQWAWAYFTYGKGARLIAKAAGKEGILPSRQST